MRPESLPPAERYAHGTRARYVSGCRCADCRAANTAHERERYRARARGEWNGLVDAAPVQAHLRKLSRQGVGRRAVAAASDVSVSVIRELRVGSQRKLRARTAQRILAVDANAAADRGRISAVPTWRLIRQLLLSGLTKEEIALRLGAETPKLQIGRKRVEARTALRVRRLHAEVMQEVEAEREVGTVCLDCGFSHAKARRQALLLRLLPCTAADVREAHPCIWAGGKGSAAEMMLYRDLADLGAVRADGEWALPAIRAAEVAA